MRWIAMTIGVLAGIMGMTCPLQAGLYNTAEPAELLSRNFFTFRKDTLIALRQIGSPQVHGTLNKRYELLATLARTAPPSLSVEQRLDLGAYLVRSQKPREAVNLLAPAQFKERDNFLVLCNLATAELLDGQPRRAWDYQADALRLWPKEWAGLSEERRKALAKLGWSARDFGWYREVEAYQLKLLRLRSKEPGGPLTQLPANVDAIFDNDGKGAVRFVGPSGRYEAGKLAPAERARLPRNAIEIVEQLLIWMPHDNRLYWLLGELFNAEGDVPAAQEIFEEVVVKWNPRASKTVAADSGFQVVSLPPLFKEHLEVLRAQPKAEIAVAEPAPVPAPAKAPVAPADTSATAPVDWRSLGVGFGVGLLVAFFGFWQIREIRRRRQPRTLGL